MSLNTKIEHIKVVTYNYRVGKRSFSFDYDLERNGYELAKCNHYNSTHTRSPSTIRKYLENGYATELVLQNNF